MMKSGILTAICCMGFCMSSPAQVMLQNPGFEAHDFSGWTTTGEGWSIDKKIFSQGEASALCRVKEGDAVGLRACLQTFSGIDPDRIIEVSLDVSAVDVYQTPNSKACLAILCMDEQGNVLKEYRSGVIIPRSTFQKLEIDDAVVLPETHQVYVMLVVEVYKTATDDDWWRFDDVRLQVH